MTTPASARQMTTGTPVTTAPAVVSTMTPRPQAPAVLLTTAEVADLLRLNVYTVRDYIRRGDLVAIRIGRELRVEPAAVDEFVHTRRTA